MKHFFTKSEQVHNIIKGLNLTKTLFVSSIIIGEKHIGKKLLATCILPNAPIISGANQEDVEMALKEYDELIISDFEKLSNKESLNFDNKRIIATANYLGNKNTMDELFAFIYTLPELSKRPEDTEYIKKLFIKESESNLMIDKNSFLNAKIPIDLSNNSKSLKKSIYRYIMKKSMQKEDIQEIIFNYIYEQLDGNNEYKRHLELYEKPLIEAGLKKFTSQLKLSQVLGINRNTLRKKIHEHNIY